MAKDDGRRRRRQLGLVLLGLRSVCSNVVHLDNESIAKVQNGETPALIEFFAPWCPHCQHYKPVWARIADRLEEQQTDVLIADIDCTDYKGVCTKNGVKGYPSVKAFHFAGVEHGHTLEVRAEDDVVDWVRQRLPGAQGVVAGSEMDASAHKRSRGGAASHSIRVRSRQRESEVTAALRVRDAISAVLFAFAPDAFDDDDGHEKATQSSRREKASALLALLELLMKGFPEKSARSGFSDLYHRLLDSSDAPGEVTAATWRRAMDEWKLPAYAAADYPACKDLGEAREEPKASAEAKYFACGLWTLLHLLAQNAPKHDFGGVRLRFAIRDFIAEFFGCIPCREHFTGYFDTCGKLLLDGTFLGIDRCELEEADDRRFSLWLWDLHNAVSCRVYQKAGGDVAMEDTQDLARGRRKLFLSDASGSFPRYVWPDNAACPMCWTYLGDGQWSADEGAVGQYLESSFSLPLDFALPGRAGSGSRATGSGSAALPYIAVVFLALVVLAIRKGFGRKVKSADDQTVVQHEPQLSTPTSSQGTTSKVIRRKNGGHRGSPLV